MEEKPVPFFVFVSRRTPEGSAHCFSEYTLDLSYVGDNGETFMAVSKLGNLADFSCVSPRDARGVSINFTVLNVTANCN